MTTDNTEGSQERRTDPQGRVQALVTRRDELIRQLWMVYRDMSYALPADGFTQADLDLWGLVTNHDAVQSRLGG